MNTAKADNGKIRIAAPKKVKCAPTAAQIRDIAFRVALEAIDAMLESDEMEDWFDLEFAKFNASESDFMKTIVEIRNVRQAIVNEWESREKTDPQPLPAKK